MKFVIHKYCCSSGFYPVVYSCKETDNRNWYLTKDGRVVRHEEWDTTEFRTREEAEKFLNNWLPSPSWITKEEVRDAASKSGEDALLASITHWKQIVLEGVEEYKKANIKGEVSDNQDYCALCQRYGTDFSDDFNGPCPLKNSVCGGCYCCEEYIEASIGINKTNKIDGAVKLLNKLISIYNTLYPIATTTLLSLKTKGVLRKQSNEKCSKEQEKYVFQAGDVVSFNSLSNNNSRIIVNIGEVLYSIDQYGLMCAKGQKDFEELNYKKIGTCVGFRYNN